MLLAKLQEKVQQSTVIAAKEAIQPPETPTMDSLPDWCAAVATRLEQSADKGHSKFLIVFAERTKTKYTTGNINGWTRWSPTTVKLAPDSFSRWLKDAQSLSTEMNDAAWQLARDRINDLRLDYLRQLADLWRSQNPDIPVNVVDECEVEHQKPYCFYTGQLEPGYDKTTQTCGLRFDWSEANKPDGDDDISKRKKRKV